MPQRYLMPQKEHKALKDELGHDPQEKGPLSTQNLFNLLHIH